MFKIVIILAMIFLTFADAKRFKSLGGKSSNQIKVGFSTLNGQSDEFVYKASGKKLSELNWKLKNVKLLNLGYTKPIKIGSLNVEYWGNTDKPKTTMDDYDWMSDVAHPNDWTHHSYHENTTVEQVTKFDLNAKFNIFAIKSGILFAKLGYRNDTIKWIARGGDFVYTSCDNPDSNGDCPTGDTYENNFRDHAWNSDADTSPGITYQQYFKSIYYGLGVESLLLSKNLPITLQAEIQYSADVQTSDTDTHHKRNLYFEDVMTDKGAMLNILTGATFVINPSILFVLSYERYEYKLSKGYSIITKTDTQEKLGRTADGSARMSHISTIMTYKIAFSF